MKKLIRKLLRWHATFAPLDILYRWRTRWLFLTSVEAEDAVVAASTLDSARGRDLVEKLTKSFAELQRIRLFRSQNYFELKLTINAKSLDAVDEEMAIQILAEACVARLKQALDKRKEQQKPR